MFIRQSIIKLSSCKGEMSHRGANKKTTMMTPIIELKRQSSRLKHYITLFLNILLVDCYVGKLL
jgi:hypothetical protein